MGRDKNVNSGKVSPASIAKNKGKTGITRKEKHLSAENKRKQAGKDNRSRTKKN